MKAAIYARSDHDTASQLAACRAYVGAQGGTVTDEYDDQGGDFALGELLNQAATGRFNTIVLQRIAIPDLDLYLDFIRIMAKLKIRVQSI